MGSCVSKSSVSKVTSKDVRSPGLCLNTSATALLVIDDQVDPTHALGPAVLPTTVVVNFDSKTHTTAEVVARISAAVKTGGGAPFACVALANHGGSEWRLAVDLIVHVGSPGYIEALHPIMAALVGAVRPGGRIDLLGCNLLAVDTTLSTQLEARYKVNFTASDDATGNTVAGGDWCAESEGTDSLNIAGDYFAPAKLDGFKETMGWAGNLVDTAKVVVKAGASVVKVGVSDLVSAVNDKVIVPLLQFLPSKPSLPASEPLRFLAQEYNNGDQNRHLVVIFVNGILNNEDSCNRSAEALKDVIADVLAAHAGSATVLINNKDDPACRVFVSGRVNPSYSTDEVAKFKAIFENMGALLDTADTVDEAAELPAHVLRHTLQAVFMVASAASAVAAIKDKAATVAVALAAHLRELYAAAAAAGQPPPLVFLVGHSHGGMCSEALVNHLATADAADLATLTKEQLVVLTIGSPVYISEAIASTVVKMTFQMTASRDPVSFKTSHCGRLRALAYAPVAKLLSCVGTGMDDIAVGDRIVTLLPANSSGKAVDFHAHLSATYFTALAHTGTQ